MTTFLDEQIAMTRAAILSYMNAEIALGTGGMQSYTIDTGQTRQTVTKQNITEVRRTIDSLRNRLQMLEVERDGAGSIIVRPC